MHLLIRNRAYVVSVCRGPLSTVYRRSWVATFELTKGVTTSKRMHDARASAHCTLQIYNNKLIDSWRPSVTHSFSQGQLGAPAMCRWFYFIFFSLRNQFRDLHKFFGRLPAARLTKYSRSRDSAKRSRRPRVQFDARCRAGYTIHASISMPCGAFFGGFIFRQRLNIDSGTA